jgi:hypothetical protein
VETNSILLLAVKLAVAEREGAMDVEEAEEEEEDAVTVDMTFAHLIPNIRILLPASYVKPPPFPPSLSLSLVPPLFSPSGSPRHTNGGWGATSENVPGLRK